MALSKNKTTAIALSIVMIFAMTIAIATPLTKAQPGVTQKTYAFVDATPDPVGVGEQALIRYGITQQLPAVLYYYDGLTITIEDPNGHTTTWSDLKTDSTGQSARIFIPDIVGTYHISFDFPDWTWNAGNFSSLEQGFTIYEGTVLLASHAEVDLIVQQEPLPDYPGHPLPTEYWSRPVDPQLREWYSITGNWVSVPKNSWALYNDDAPETAHVLWAHPLTTGGLTGGLWGDGVPASSETGDAYEGKFPGSVILNGILYYQRTDTRRETAPAIIAIDLHSGEQWMFRNNTVLSFGQVFYFNSYNYDGVFTYIWSVSGSTYTAYDPFTGNQQIQITNVPTSYVNLPFTAATTRTFGPSGEILIYILDTGNNWLALWNSTDCGLQNAVIGTPDYGSWGNTAHGNALGPGLNGMNPRSFTWNVTIPAGIQTGTSFFAPVIVPYPDRVMSAYWTYDNVRVWALDTDGLTKSSTSTSFIFDEDWTPPAEWGDGRNTIQYDGSTNQVENGVFTLWDKELRKHYAFSTETGKYLWQTESEAFLDYLGWGNVEHTWYYAYDHLYSTGVGGIVYGFYLENGTTAWTYTMSDPYNEPVTGENWWGWIDLIADGKIYVGTLEHSAEQPIPRGGPYICLNATTGEEIWRVNGMFRETRWGGNGVIGDSIIATMDTYDQRVYAIGKGPTATSICCQSKIITEGDSVMVEGMVTDTSPGTEEYALTARFPNGVPAVADDNQSEWMLYVYKQFERPADVLGVEVTISVLDPNGNVYDVATTTSDANGFYKAMFTPQVPGEYTIIASFAGSKAYYGSNSETGIGVVQAVQTAPPTEPPGDYTYSYVTGFGIGIIIAVVVIGVVIILMLRKR
jgi:hypothetical protein